MPKLTGDCNAGVALESKVGVPVRLGSLNGRGIGE
jgi:hypothetical protein